MSRRQREQSPDLIHSIIEWLARESTLDIEQLQRMEADLRKRHGGKVQWISERALFALGDRNALIQEAWISNVSATCIARKFHLSTRRVRQICAGLPRQGNLLIEDRT